MDLCITIRTMVKKGNLVYLQAGAGIVAFLGPGDSTILSGLILYISSMVILSFLSTRISSVKIPRY